MDDDTPDAPIEEIARLRHEAAPGLAAAIRRSIQRRVMASSAVELAWKAPFALVLEFLRMAFALFAGPTPKPEERNDA